jgi:hypothetical protein
MNSMSDVTGATMFDLISRVRTKAAFRVVAFCLIVGFSSSAASASGVAFTAGFEQPDYVPGALQTQAGWLWDGTGQSTVGASSAVVQNAIAKTGAQAVLVTRAPNSDRHWAMPKTGLPTQRFIAVDWDMRVSEAPLTTGYGPFFGVDSNDRTSGIARVLGTLGVDASTGEVLFQQTQTGFLTPTTSIVAFDQWNHYRFVLDFLTDSYKGFVNGVQVVDSHFVDDTSFQELNTFSDADIMAVAAEADAVSQALTSSAVYDNFVVRDGLLGDYDIDGDVDNADYTRWRATFGQSVSVPGNLADGNKNGVVDAADYAVWRDNLGTSLFTGVSPGLGSAVVPEPGALALGVLSMAAVAWAAGRRRAG